MRGERWGESEREGRVREMGEREERGGEERERGERERGGE